MIFLTRFSETHEAPTAPVNVLIDINEKKIFLYFREL